jgi:hypothetical protein
MCPSHLPCTMPVHYRHATVSPHPRAYRRLAATCSAPIFAVTCCHALMTVSDSDRISVIITGCRCGSIQNIHIYILVKRDLKVLRVDSESKYTNAMTAS